MIRFGSLSPVDMKGPLKLPWSNCQPTTCWADLLRQPTPPIVKTAVIVPRGLINEGNLCFMNSMLQPLVYCPLFVDTILSLQAELDLMPPLLRAMSIFLNEFLNSNASGPFTPEYVYEALKKSDSIKGRQEDASEFLGFLINGLHDELLKVESQSPLLQTLRVDSEEWLEMGPKKQTIPTRKSKISESSISRIFSGKLRSILKCHGSKPSITIEPFQSLHLQITSHDVYSIKSALCHLSVKERIEGYASPQKKDAYREVYIEELPPILILHLKRFVFKNGSIHKFMKHIDIPSQLDIPDTVLAPSLRLSGTRTYQLFAIVNHHGASTDGGHYTAHVKQASGEWLWIDDTVIKPVSLSQVLSERKEYQPYILFYAES